MKMISAEGAHSALTRIKDRFAEKARIVKIRR
jgi:hypothetical protein